MIGIDVSKETLAVCCWDESAKRSRWEQAFPNTKAGIRQLLRLAATAEPWVVEPTGSYSELVAHLGQQAGREVLSAPPRAARQFLTSLNPRAKTDAVDAKGLAQFGASRPLRPYVLPQGWQRTMRHLLAARKGLSRSLSSLRQQARALPEAAALLRPATQDLAKRLKAVDERIAQLSKQQPECARLDAIPGFGPVVSAALAVRLQMTQFERADQFVAYIGLDLRVRESGKLVGRRKLSKNGDADLRWLLYLAAQASQRSNDRTFAGQCERELAKGLTKTQALCAVARKMAKVAWALMRSGQEYNPARVYSQVSLDKQP